MRVAHVVSNFGLGGTERHVLTLAAAQRDAGIDAMVLTVGDGYLARACAEHGVPVTTEIQLNPPGTDPKAPAENIAKLTAALAELAPDVVHAHLHRAGSTVAPAAQELGLPMVYTLHLAEFDHFLAAQFALGNHFPVISVFEGGVRSIVRDAPRADLVFHVPNGVRRPAPRDVRIGGEDARPRLITPARISREKGLDVAVLAMKLLRDRFAGRCPVLHLFGEGPDETMLKTLADQLGVSDVVRFRGSVPDIIHPELDAHAMVLPSRSEACPLAVLEAMSCGIPVVATAVGGVCELIPDGEHGVLTIPDSPRELAAGVARLLTDEALSTRCSANASARYEKEYTAELMAERTLGVYDRCAF